MAFPFLTVEEFDCACAALVDRVHALGTADVVGWSSIQLMRQATGPILKISQSFDHPSGPCHNDDSPSRSVEIHDSLLETFEDDPEALIRTSDPRAGLLQVDYDILLSTTYRVPVLYFTLRCGCHLGPTGIDTVYQHLVPEQHRKELQKISVMGGISFGYHPVSGIPTFFVHPCNTADAMKQIAGHQTVTPESYLIIWIGLVGSRLSLHLPSVLFADKNPNIPKGGK